MEDFIWYPVRSIIGLPTPIPCMEECIITGDDTDEDSGGTAEEGSGEPS
jgi:hypothetical protein